MGAAVPAYGEFEVSILYIEPRIWRRFQIGMTATFADLHQAIQDSFGWEDCHLWQFRHPTQRSRVLAGVPDDQFASFDTEEVPDGREVKLSEHFTAKDGLDGCAYLYDFGDDWHHKVDLIRITSSSDRFRRRLLDGGRSCPPEDCGGVGGYGRLLELLETGEDQYEEDPDGLATWLGDWKPDSFDLQTVKAAFDR